MKCDVSRDRCYSWWPKDRLWDHLIMLNGKLCEVSFLINITSFITSFLSKLPGKDTLELHVMSKQYMDKESYLSMCLSPTTNLKLGRACHPFTQGQNLHFLQRVKSWPGKEGHILNEFLLWILISQSKGFFLESSLLFL